MPVTRAHLAKAIICLEAEEIALGYDEDNNRQPYFLRLLLASEKLQEAQSVLILNSFLAGG